jgi:signal transduction histidine kinase
VPQPAPIQVASDDELGRLTAAFNQMRATAVGLIERQLVTRQNVSLMFANVAQRTQNLVSRQLVLVDELERNEQDAGMLASLYQLDHLSTRLRRNADNLLVVAGARDEIGVNGPTDLSTALRAALAQIEDYKRVRIPDPPDLRVSAPLGADLVLLFAELLENATSFSPPHTTVEVEVVPGDDGCCTLAIVDHGHGHVGRPDRGGEQPAGRARTPRRRRRRRCWACSSWGGSAVGTVSPSSWSRPPAAAA